MWKVTIECKAGRSEWTDADMGRAFDYSRNAVDLLDGSHRITLEGDEESDPEGRIYSSQSGRGFAVLALGA
jgi:hypothetical protein